MHLEQISGPHCVGKSCPTIYKSDRGTIVVQGYVVDEPHNAALASVRALRYESLPAYRTDEERDAFDAFLSGRTAETQFLDDWLDFLREATAAGKQVIRLRLVPEPHTKYFEFEKRCGYARSVQAGEVFFELRRGDLADELLSIPDFWLFDDQAVAVMHYAPDGTYEHAEVIEDPATVQRYSQTARRLESLASPMSVDD